MKNNKKEEEKPKNHLALYRKYRPSRFEDMLGQESVLQTLQNAIKQNKIYHAYIFSGDRGTGKTTAARIFAKEIGCSPDDIFELDAASNNSVENIRLLIDSTQASTFGSRYKVYILDEAHMLSKSAFNALLKTLEEPPEHVIFILATTDRHKLPATIISRCQDIRFSSPSIATLVKHIENISKEEGYHVAKEAEEEIARAGKGSFRDTLGVLEKILNSANKSDISKEDVDNILGIIDENKIFKLLESVCKKDTESVLRSINELSLETDDMIEKAYISLIKMFELALYFRLVREKEAQKFLYDKIGEDLVENLNGLANLYPKIISSTNLYKLLDIEKDIIGSMSLKGSILNLGLLRIIEEDIT